MLICSAARQRSVNSPACAAFQGAGSTFNAPSDLELFRIERRADGAPLQQLESSISNRLLTINRLFINKNTQSR
jgi:hypothetical protein